VIGDTTTTMMWIEGVDPVGVTHAYIGAVVAFAIFAVPAALIQHNTAPITRDVSPDLRVDGMRVGVVLFILVAAVATNVVVNLHFSEHADAFPFLAAAIWLALLVASPLRQPDWGVIPKTALSSLFLISLVTAASMMPVSELPAPSWVTALGLGFVSSVFDNIPLTKLALDQGGYDWGMLAYAVGFGGSITWFGSSAGVAVSIVFPEIRSVLAWLRHGWAITLGYLIGFLAILALSGWTPENLGG